MKVRGLDALQRHVPELRTVRGLMLAPLGIAAVAALTILFFLAADRYFAEWMPDGEIVVLALGFLMLSRFYSQRKRYQELYGEGAYARAFVQFAVPGLGIIAASLAHLAFIAGPDIPDVWWKPWLQAVGYLFLLSGLLLWLRAVATAGIDSLAMLYVYYPAEGSRMGSGINALLRHPIYAAAQDIGFGLALIHASWYALLVAVLLPIFFWGWVRLVEEKDLLERFPDYAEYRKRVPAFGPTPANLFKFWRMLVVGK